MNRGHLTLLIVVALGLAGFGGYEARIATAQREQLAALREMSAQIAAESAKQRSTRDAALRELPEAERQLAALPILAASSPDVSSAQRSEMKAWLARVKELRRLFAENPGLQIPELRLLTDQDWLLVAKSARLDSDDDRRRALAEVRNAAMARFTLQLSAALRKLVETSPAQTPTLANLAPLLDPPVEANLLDRYALDKTTDARKAPEWRVQQKSAIDPDYDARYSVTVSADGRSSGGRVETAPEAWIENFRPQLEAAHKAYMAANQGALPKGLAEVLPYFNPPLHPAVVEKLLKAERERKR